MDVIEKAIRNALEKGDAQDRAYRENVYRSAFSALEKALKANPTTTVESAIKRRRTLQTTITEIEQLYIAPPPPAPVAPSAPMPASRSEPEDFLGAAPDADHRLVTQPETRGRSRTQKDRRKPKSVKKGRSVFATLFTTATLAAFALVGLWWAISTGLIGSPTNRTGSGNLASENYASSSNGPKTVSQEQSLEGWTEIFDAGQADAVIAASAGQAQAMQDDSGRFLRVTPSGNSTLTFPITQTVLSELGGSRAMFNIVARSSDGTPTQIAVECDFGAMGGCGRTRYDVPALRGENLFEVDLGQAVGTDGAIHIDVNVQQDGKAVDIYEIRALREGQ